MSPRPQWDFSGGAPKHDLLAEIAKLEDLITNPEDEKLAKLVNFNSLYCMKPRNLMKPKKNPCRTKALRDQVTLELVPVGEIANPGHAISISWECRSCHRHSHLHVDLRHIRAMLTRPAAGAMDAMAAAKKIMEGK